MSNDCVITNPDGMKTIFDSGVNGIVTVFFVFPRQPRFNQAQITVYGPGNLFLASDPIQVTPPDEEEPTWTFTADFNLKMPRVKPGTYSFTLILGDQQLTQDFQYPFKD